MFNIQELKHNFFRGIIQDSLSKGLCQYLLGHHSTPISPFSTIPITEKKTSMMLISEIASKSLFCNIEKDELFVILYQVI